MPLRRLPYAIEDLRGEGGLVLRQEATIVPGHHIRRVLDGVARLLIGAGLFQNMSGEHIADIVRPMRQKTLDGAAPRIGG